MRKWESEKEREREREREWGGQQSEANVMDAIKREIKSLNEKRKRNKQRDLNNFLL